MRKLWKLWQVCHGECPQRLPNLQLQQFPPIPELEWGKSLQLPKFTQFPEVECCQSGQLPQCPQLQIATVAHFGNIPAQEIATTVDFHDIMGVAPVVCQLHGPET